VRSRQVSEPPTATTTTICSPCPLAPLAHHVPVALMWLYVLVVGVSGFREFPDSGIGGRTWRPGGFLAARTRGAPRRGRIRHGKGHMVMIGFMVGLWRARTTRPLLWWVVALLAYAVFPLPSEWVLLLIVGLGVALTVTVRRLRESGQVVQRHSERAWDLADRLSAAVEDRIRGTAPPHAQPYPVGYAPPVPTALGPVGVVYDPGALLSAVVAVLAAEGLPANAGPALPACVQLLSWLGIGVQAGVPAPTAHGLVTALLPGAPGRPRAVPPGLVASVIRAVLTEDGVLPAQITTDDAEALITGSALILEALGIAPDDMAGPLGAWPVMAEIIDAAPQPPPYEPPTGPYQQWGR